MALASLYSRSLSPKNIFSATLEWLLEYNANPFGLDWQPNILITVSCKPQMETSIGAHIMLVKSQFKLELLLLEREANQGLSIMWWLVYDAKNCKTRKTFAFPCELFQKIPKSCLMRVEWIKMRVKWIEGRVKWIKMRVKWIKMRVKWKFKQQ